MLPGRTLKQLVPIGARIRARRAPAVLRHYLTPTRRLQQDLRPWPHVWCRRSSPLRRPGTTYDEELQHAKETNVRRAAELLEGTVITPGDEFSWHAQVGPPLRIRGFAKGPELHAGRMSRGTGGGACQVANLVFWLALHSGLAILERHRHALDLFPDSERTVPFGCGATVFHPTRDLRLSNPHAAAVRLHLRVADGRLFGAMTTQHAPTHEWRVEEVWHRFVERQDGIWRENRLDRFRTDQPNRREIVAINQARVAYAVPPEALTREDR